MTQLHFDGPINSLSFGNVSLNFLRELHKTGLNISIYPTGAKADFSAFDKIDPSLVEWITESAHNRHVNLNSKAPTLKLWHINGAEQRVAPKQFLYTFYECSQPTPDEIAIVNSQEHVFFSSSYAAEKFREAGCKNVSFIPIGFDPDFRKTSKEYFGESTTHFGLIGKLEKRKNTLEIIKVWLDKFGNDSKYQLTCLINNPFFKREDFESVISRVVEGGKFTNINFLPNLKTNSEVNDLLNSIDIDLSGLSSSEGWGLPAFNATALGKWSLVSNCSAHKDWANEQNCVLVEPDGEIACYDEMFFVKGARFNQGNFFNIGDDQISDALDRSLSMAKYSNPHGELLRTQFTYEKTITSILEKIL